MEGTINTGNLILSGPQDNISDLSISFNSSYEQGFNLRNFPSASEQRAEFAVTLRQELNSLTLSDAHFNRFVTLNNSHKGHNRYTDVLPFSHNTVPLSLPPHYINASFVHGIEVPNDERLYIACQGPLPQTVPVFWGMVWENAVSVIVMLCNVTEGKKPKCEQYWPQESSEVRMGSMQVRLVNSTRTVWGCLLYTSPSPRDS